jgi:hypothetical protein|tara:strand:- start:2525 stop:2707 length:183 start_codon:yes stop_codon:yes gene_type:complete
MKQQDLEDCADSIYSMIEEQILDTIDFYIESENIELDDDLSFEYRDKAYQLIINKLKEQL